MGMVGEACLPSSAYYPRMPDYTLYSGVNVCWSEHSNLPFVCGFMSLDYGLGNITTTTNHIKIEPAHDKPYNKTCANSEDSDLPTHPCSLIRVFADCLCFLQPPGYSQMDKREPLPYWFDVQIDLSITQVLW